MVPEKSETLEAEPHLVNLKHPRTCESSCRAFDVARIPGETRRAGNRISEIPKRSLESHIHVVVVFRHSMAALSG
jgi:hypothetical protein